MGVWMANGQQCSLELKGHIEDADSKQKLAGATVFIDSLGIELVTDDKGDFVFKNLCAGTYRLRISHVGCETIEQNVVLTKNRHVDINLPHLKNTLSEVTINAMAGIQNTGTKAELTGKALDITKGENLAEALSRINGVSMLQTGSTISKPVIHGLHSNRILTINNGVRQEGQQWGNEHAPEIDPYIAGKLTVIKGVDELKYGSDAIGGVILVDPKPLLGSPGYNAELNAGYFTNNKLYVLSGMYEQQLKTLPAFTYRIQGTYRKAANVATPNYRLNNTGLEEQNFSITAGWKKHQLSSELFYSFFNTQLGIFSGAHIGNLSDLSDAIASDRPDPVFTGQQTYSIQRPRQEARHQILKSKTFLQKGKHKYSLLLAAQINDRKEFDIVRNSNNLKPQLDVSLVTFSEEITREWLTGNAFTHTAGITSVQQENQYAGRYFIPYYKSFNLGGYYIVKWNKEKWDVQTGVRFDQKNIRTNRLLADSIVFDEYDFNFATLGASLNAGYTFSKQLKINGTITLATRAPHVNELLSNGIHHGTATFEVGNINLKEEQSLNSSINATWSNKSETFSVQGTLYRNQINNFIYQQPKPNEPVLTIAGAFPKWVYQQNNALLSGTDIATRLQPMKQLSFTVKYSMLRAKNTDLNDWLIRMPADRINSELNWDFEDGKRLSKTFLSAALVYTAEQTRVPDEKNGAQDYKDAPAPYKLVNASFGTTVAMFKLPVTISITARNMFNVVYRDYLNSMRYFTDEMGRNIQLRLKIPFKHLK
jgi:iron complex outermembrane receptor protein